MSTPECVFCRIVAGEIPTERVAESTNFLAMLDIAPHMAGHTLVLPKKHATTFLDLPEYLGNEFIEFSQRVAQAVMVATGADGFNLVVNTGTAAGQVVHHFHAHILPRKANDGVHLNEKPHGEPAMPLTQVRAMIVKQIS